MENKNLREQMAELLNGLTEEQKEVSVKYSRGLVPF